LNGYSTAAFGKYHETPPWEASVSGPYDRWPTGSGFDKFYGFIGGETNQWAPAVYDGVTRVETPDDPNYHFTTDMTDRAIAWTRFQQALTPEKPFYTCDATCFVHWNGVLPACAQPMEKCGNVIGPPHSSMCDSCEDTSLTMPLSARISL